MSNEQVKNRKTLFHDPAEHRIRSFVTRSGRLSGAQERAISCLGPRFIIPFARQFLNLADIFHRDGETILEIGFGMGEPTAQIAQAMPEKNFIGMEVHTPGIGNLLKLIDEKQLSNIRIIRHDAVEVLMHMIPENTVDGIHIFFPDPWHKTRHHKRRLIQPSFVQLLGSRLKPGGYIHCATDWEPYAIQMLEVMESAPYLENMAHSYAPRPAYRPETKFEKRGKRLGHGIWDLVFKKR